MQNTCKISVNLLLDTLCKTKVKYWELAALLCLYSSGLKHVRPRINCMVLCKRGVIVSVQSPMDITSFRKTVSGAHFGYFCMRQVEGVSSLPQLLLLRRLSSYHRWEELSAPFKGDVIGLMGQLCCRCPHLG